jgi:LacI family transcriptional regulator
MTTKEKSKKVKYKEIYDYLYHRIQSGTYRPGGKIPTENELATSFNASRPTVSKALRDLETRGLINRIQGSGSFISESVEGKNLTLGLLTSRDALSSGPIRGLSIFSQIVPEISMFASQEKMALVLGHSPFLDRHTFANEAFESCNDFIKRGVNGIFFLPFETSDETIVINQQIVERFMSANIRVVLLDRDITDDMTQRSQFDIVGLDNSRAAYVLTSHLIEHGCKKIHFLTENIHNSVVKDRFFGYQRAMWEKNLPNSAIRVMQITDQSIDAVKKQLLSLSTEAIVCCNDAIASTVINAFQEAGVKVPDDVKIAGFDDVPIAAHLNPPLTTIHQPVSTLAKEAVKAMRDRIENPSGPPKDIKVHGDLITRKSCGCMGS